MQLWAKYKAARQKADSQRLRHSGLFDKNYYLEKSPDLKGKEISPELHYIMHGAAEGRDPHPLFSTNYYLSQNRSLNPSRTNPLLHYLRFGYKKEKNPHPLFDSKYYTASCPETLKSGINPLLHFLNSNIHNLHSPHSLFNLAFYLTSNPSIMLLGVNPLIHYVVTGFKHNCDPNENFSSAGYLRRYSDVRKKGVNPLIHYVLFGKDEGRCTQPFAVKDDNFFPVEHSAYRQQILNKTVDVIVPVYRGLHETRLCIESVLNSNNKNTVRLIVINDFSPEPELCSYLSSLARSDALIFINNNENLGFVRSVNIGMSISTTNDVVLLNNDTVLSDYWLDRLLYHAYACENIGTVSPFSNNATFCNFPSLKGFSEFPQGDSLHSINEACFNANAGRSIEVPTAVGFCMFIRRECLNEVGFFDANTFGKGYGEENDFCERATLRGWTHRHAMDVFVYHQGELSFRSQSKALKEKALKLLKAKYPDFEKKTSLHALNDPAHPYRCAATAMRVKKNPKPCLLFIEHKLGGGISRHTADLVKALRSKANILFLRPLKASGAGVDAVLSPANPSEGNDIEFNTDEEFDFLVKLIRSYAVQRVHIHHNFGFRLDLHKLISCLNLPFDFTVHDYQGICPKINFVLPEGKYCGEPNETECNLCIPRNPVQDAKDIHSWRQKHAWLYKDAERVICPSIDSAKRISRYYPSARIIVAPHEASRYRMEKPIHLTPLGLEERARIVILGVLGRHKGFFLLRDVAALAAETNARFDFKLIGFSPEEIVSDIPLPLSITGQYDNADLDKLIAKANPHLIWFPVICPETYSYTLSNALSGAYPIVAPNLGALPERLLGRAWTWLVDPLSSPSSFLKLFSMIAGYLRTKESPVVSPQLEAPNLSSVSLSFYDNDYLKPTEQSL